MTTKPMMPTTVIWVTAPVISTTTPTTKTSGGEQGSAARGGPQRGAPHRRRELGVLGDQGALHLLEQTQLFFRERHGDLPPGD